MTVIVFFLATIFGIFVGGMVLAQVGGRGQLMGVVSWSAVNIVLYNTLYMLHCN